MFQALWIPVTQTMFLNYLILRRVNVYQKSMMLLVTAPIQKSIINDAGINFSGHTEYFSKRCGGALPVMLLTCPELRVALVTTHLALREVPDAITPERVDKTIRTRYR